MWYLPKDQLINIQFLLQQINQEPRHQGQQSRKQRKPPRTPSVDWHPVRALKRATLTPTHPELICCCLPQLPQLSTKELYLPLTRTTAETSFKMVNEVYANASPSLYGSSPSRSEMSKRAGFQNMQKMEAIRKLSVKSQQAPKAPNSFGPMFRDRDHFASLHFC